MIDLKSKIGEILTKIKEFISNNQKMVIIIISAVIFVLISILVLVLVFSLKKDVSSNSRIRKTELSSKISDFKAGKINPDKLELIDEPINLPPIQFSREQRKIWEKEEVDYWYEPPTEKDMEELHKQNKKIADNILEAAP